MNLRVVQIPARETLGWLLQRHYAKRRCPVSFAFGVYRGPALIGVVTYGTPASSPLRNGICGNQWADKILELNRLCCENTKNVASILIGRSLRLLPKPSVVVSFADTDRGHIGYVYQATNFIYTGMSAKRTDWKIRGQEHLHGATVADKSRGQENRAQWMRHQYGDDFYLAERARKHRYLFFVGTPRQKAAARAALLYSVEAFPKGESSRYDVSETIETQDTLFAV